VGPSQDWQPTEKVFQQFLHWLDEGSDSEGQRYLEVRRRLEVYFDRKNCVAPGELADETLSRVARKLEENGEITDVGPLEYCYIVAKYVFLEALRAEKRAPFYRPVANASPGNVSGQSVTLLEADAASDPKEKIAACLDHCLKNLSNADRDLVVEYYRGQQRGKVEQRAALAARLGITADALSIRTCRVRQKLEACVNSCLKRVPFETGSCLRRVMPE
jgi:DNA-directed RNA polymerase specialized sigma24 family protein